MRKPNTKSRWRWPAIGRNAKLPEANAQRDVDVCITETKRRFTHRGTVADLGVMRQMFDDKDYCLDKLKRGAEINERYHDLVRRGLTPLILDCGANIGASAVYFGCNYPMAHIVCFEPDADNFELLVRNSVGLDADLRKEAVGSTNALVSVVDVGEGSWGLQTELNPHGDVKRVAISEVVETKVGLGFVPFIGKFDIEGGEADLFCEPYSWTDRFPLLIVELHDWLLPKQQTSKTFLKMSANSNRDFVHIGENVFSIKN
jgi:FkbM family methyltransferase